MFPFARIQKRVGACPPPPDISVDSKRNCPGTTPAIGSPSARIDIAPPGGFTTSAFVESKPSPSNCASTSPSTEAVGEAKLPFAEIPVNIGPPLNVPLRDHTPINGGTPVIFWSPVIRNWNTPLGTKLTVGSDPGPMTTRSSPTPFCCITICGGVIAADEASISALVVSTEPRIIPSLSLEIVGLFVVPVRPPRHKSSGAVAQVAPPPPLPEPVGL